MNKIQAFTLFIALAFWGCEEAPLNIPDLKVGARRVLIEELTGVKCTNCPDGARLLENLQTTYGKENLIVISIHAVPDFSVPFTGATASLYDFRTEDGTTMYNFISPYEGVPCASISRILPPNATSRFITPPGEWPSLINAEFKKDYSLGLFVQTEYVKQTRQLDINVNIAPEKTLDGNHRLTVVITQDSIVDLQDDNGVIANYTHRHVLRDVISQPTGDDITEGLTGGALIKKNYSIVLPEEWEAKHCSVVAYVHHTGTPDMEVLQVAESHVKEE
jgi:hypothetical protein